MRNDSNGNTELIFAAFAVALAVGIGLLYEYNRGAFNSVFMWINGFQLWIASFFSDEAAQVENALRLSDPWAFQWAHMEAQFDYAGSFTRWLTVPLLLLLAVMAYRPSAAEFFVRKMDMELLLKHNVKFFPAIAPVVNRFRSLFEEPLTSGRWRAPLSPVEFAAENAILLFDSHPIHKQIDMIVEEGGEELSDGFSVSSPFLKKENIKKLSYDSKASMKVLRSQLGGEFLGFASLEPHQQALAAAFAAFVCSAKKESKELLDQLSLSFCEPEDGAEGEDNWGLDFEGVEDTWKKYSKSPRVRKVSYDHGAHIHTWLCGLLESAREKGVLSTAEFIWLRPYDRSLWYCLNQVGRRESWAESLGCYVHMLAEKELGECIVEPQVVEGVKGLEQSLIKEGWLQEDDRKGRRFSAKGAK